MSGSVAPDINSGTKSLDSGIERLEVSKTGNIIAKNAHFFARPQWVTWRLKEIEGKRKKVPYHPNGKHAKTDNSRTWVTHDEAESDYLFGNNADGIGFVFTADDPYLFIDLDHVISEDGSLIEWAREIVDEIDSYTEISPSGNGLHIFVEAQYPEKLKNKTQFEDGSALEIYFKERYSTFTGRIFEDRDTIKINPVDVLYNYADPITSTGVNIGDDRKSRLSVNDVVEMLQNKGYWDGYDTSDNSEADAQFANHVVYYCNGDFEVFEEVFSLHDFGQRDKWRKRKDYRKRTFDLAMKGRTKFFDPDPDKEKKNPFNTVGVTPLSLLEGFAMTEDAIQKYANLEFLYDGLIVRGYHHYLYGPAGAGKTTTAYFLMIEMASKHPDHIFIFFYLDGALSMASKMLSHVDELGLKNIRILTEGSSQDYNAKMEEFGKHQAPLHNYVFIYDTFKFLSDDMNNKNANKKAMHLVKDLTRLGATFISLGHTNKDKKRESGTAEIEQDSDAMLRVDSFENDGRVTTSIVKGGRCRFDVTEMSFEYEAGDPSTVVKKDMFEVIVDSDTASIIHSIKEILEDGPKKQREIEEALNIPRNKLLKILHDESRIGTWKIEKGEKNSKIYSLDLF